VKPPGLLVNVRAGGVLGRPGLVERLRALVPPDHIRLTASPGEIAPALADLRDRGVEMVAIVGGDGTSTWTLTALARTWPEESLPAVLLLPGGTINTIPASVGVHGRADRALARLLEPGGRATIRRRRVLRVVPSGEEPRLALIFGNGVVARWLARYNSRAHRGRWIAAADVARSLGSVAIGGPIARALLAPFQGEVEVDGEARAGSFTGMAAGAVRHIGLGFRPFLTIPTEGSLDHFHWIETSAGGFGLALELPAARLGLLPLAEGLRHAAARAVRVRLAKPEPYTLDGDLFPPCADLRVELGPEIRFAYPDSGA
jgi:diacylglycerol kinase family enzyme